MRLTCIDPRASRSISEAAASSGARFTGSDLLSSTRSPTLLGRRPRRYRVPENLVLVHLLKDARVAACRPRWPHIN